MGNEKKQYDSPRAPQGVSKQSGGSAQPHGSTLRSAYKDPVDGDDAIHSQQSPEEASRLSGRVRVVVRCRPLMPGMDMDYSSKRIFIDGNNVIVYDKVMQHEGRSFQFDRVLTPEADQSTVFAEVAPLADHVLDGFHATVFAYGQTGSGKTYTMDGFRYTSNSQQRKALIPDLESTPVEQHGIMPRVIQLLFDRARERQRAAGVEYLGAQDEEIPDDGVEVTFRCSFYEIYNEKITDLLRGCGVSSDGSDAAVPSMFSGPTFPKIKEDSSRIKSANQAELRVRWHKGDVFKVENLFICTCNSADEMRSMFFSGVKQKVVRGHLMNHQSSRSHCVFTIYVETRARRNGELLSQSELSLVDLAGSEKISLLSHNPSTQLFKESIDINTSLLSLGKVITALGSGVSTATSVLKKKNITSASRSRGRSDQKADVGHIPYRDSKLTMLLKHALGGNSLTTMIACISPSDRYVDETVSTLLYAGRAKNIRNAPHVNEDATTILVRRLREEITQLKAELGYYREMAKKSLGEREYHTKLCKRCGEDANANSPAAGDKQGPVASATGAVPLTDQEVDQLSDSLVDACGMLSNLMLVNSQLRESYDTLREVQDAAERRESALNSENLALRERLALLEEIVLRDEDVMKCSDEEREVDEEEVSRDSVSPLAEEKRRSGQTVSGTHPPQVALAAEEVWGAAAAPVDSPRETVHGVHPAGGATVENISSPKMTTFSPLIEPYTSEKGEHRRENDTGAALSWKEERPLTVATSGEDPFTMTEQLSRALRGVSDSSPSPNGAADASVKHHTVDPKGEEERQGVPLHKKRNKQKRYGVLETRLKEYEARYRSPYAIETYADYYKQPTRRRSTTVTAPVVPSIRASTFTAPQVTTTLREMEVVVAKLPAVVVQDYVPTSLLQPGLFGSLAFGGSNAERAPFEKNRISREQRLREIQQRQQELYRQVHMTIHEISSEDQENPICPPSLLSASNTVNGDLEQVHTTNPCLRSTSREKRSVSGRTLSAYASRAPNSLHVHQTRRRIATASYLKSSRPQRSNTTPDSWTRLVEYLERGK